ncbi:hypothetical protein QIA34_06370 (plasmid) [Borreliella yangtzensis]|uniref:hypothetical protein n=1 Tax=Borreliella yangtzensis TaxID=683292 RepID=UPI003B20CA83
MKLKKDEIIKVKTLIALDEGGDNHKLNINFPVKKEDKNKTLFEIIGIGLEYFINQIGAENIVEVKSLNHLMGFGLIVVYKEKKK